MRAGDEIVLCISEHHSNLVPWQQVARIKGASLKYLYLDQDYRLVMEEVRSRIARHTQSCGRCTYVKCLRDHLSRGRSCGVGPPPGSSSGSGRGPKVPHLPVDVQALGADFLAFSGHKVYGPMGIGVLYGREELLLTMPPYQYGGDMIEYVEEQSSTFADLPNKFEAGTPNVEGAVGLAAALDYLEGLGPKNILRHELELTAYALAELSRIPWVTIHGPRDTVERGR